MGERTSLEGPTMSKDPIAQRFETRQRQEKLDERARKNRTQDDLDLEDHILKDTPKTDPIRKADTEVGRNDPCPCGSGKKFKKCCEGTEKKT